MTSVVSGFTSAGSSNGSAGGTEFLSMQAPAGDALKGYDNTKPHNQQNITLPQVFADAMSIREEVFGEQGVPLEAEFDEDDPRSWHWVVYASVASTSSPSPPSLHPIGSSSKDEEERRSSATAQRLPVGTIRLVPPPHGPNKYKADLPEGEMHRPDSDPPPQIAAKVQHKHPTEPYVKLGRLAILQPYRKLGLSKLLINAAVTFTAQNPFAIWAPPSPTTVEVANRQGKDVKESMIFKGLIMVHAQATVRQLWEKVGFKEELVNSQGEVEIPKEDHWIEEGIEHLGMWKRVKFEDPGRL